MNLMFKHSQDLNSLLLGDWAKEDNPEDMVSQEQRVEVTGPYFEHDLVCRGSSETLAVLKYLCERELVYVNSLHQGQCLFEAVAYYLNLVSPPDALGNDECQLTLGAQEVRLALCARLIFGVRTEVLDTLLHTHDRQMSLYAYISEMIKETTWGDSIMLYLIGQVFDLQICVISDTLQSDLNCVVYKPFGIDTSADHVIYLIFCGNVHYTLAVPSSLLSEDTLLDHLIYEENVTVKEVAVVKGRKRKNLRSKKTNQREGLTKEVETVGPLTWSVTRESARQRVVRMRTAVGHTTMATEERGAHFKLAV